MTASVLADLYAYFGSDLSTNNNGDLMTVTGTVRGQQRVLRRLLTNPGDYVWEPTYGAGLPQYVGQPLDIGKLQALILAQMLLEPSVAQSPAPVVTVSQSTTDVTSIDVTVAYNDQPSDEPVVLNFTVS